MLRLSAIAARNPRLSLRAVAALGAVWVVCWLVGAQLVAAQPDRLDVDGEPRRSRGEHGAGRNPRQRRLRQGNQARHLPQHARQQAAHRTAWQGRAARVPRVLRPGLGPELLLLAGHRHDARKRNEAAAGLRLLGSQRLPQILHVRRRQLAGALDPGVGRLGRQHTALQPARRHRPLHAQRRVPTGAAGASSTTSPSDDRAWPEGEKYYHCEKIYERAQRRLQGPVLHVRVDARPVHVLGAADASSSARPTDVPCSRRSTRCRATCRGTASPTT